MFYAGAETAALGAVPAAFPGAATRLPVAEMTRFVLEGLPLAAVAHSYHVDALVDPVVRRSPSYQRYSLIELNELHHQVSVLGALLRLQSGDPAALRALGLNLAGFLENRAAGLQAFQALPPAVRQHPVVQTVARLTEQSNRQIAANWPLLSQVLAVTGAPPVGPLLVGRAL